MTSSNKFKSSVKKVMNMNRFVKGSVPSKGEADNNTLKEDKPQEPKKEPKSKTLLKQTDKKKTTRNEAASANQVSVLTSQLQGDNYDVINSKQPFAQVSAN